MAPLYVLGLIIVPHLVLLDLLVWQSCRHTAREYCIIRLSSALRLVSDAEAPRISTRDAGQKQ